MTGTVSYFITWTSYGTWLPGDERGWMDWRRGWKPANSKIADYARSIMTEETVVLSERQRQTVEDTIVKHCEIRGWHLWAQNCRTNHVHVVVTALDYDGETVRDQLKAWCTRNLKSQQKAKKNWWTEGGFIEEIENEEGLSAAIQYTLEAQ